MGSPEFCDVDVLQEPANAGAGRRCNSKSWTELWATRVVCSQDVTIELGPGVVTSRWFVVWQAERAPDGSDPDQRLAGSAELAHMRKLFFGQQAPLNAEDRQIGMVEGFDSGDVVPVLGIA